YQRQNKKENLLATPNRNSSPTYRWATPFTRLRKENSFGKFVKLYGYGPEILLGDVFLVIDIKNPIEMMRKWNWVLRRFKSTR
ncbi:hypothetical protein, partial [Bacillus thuringiensis]|uniref:hypothetical protein n=1 Tax=Bacillus thuringiensis TaxID=1428 RepID=UPI001A91B414